MDTAVVVWFFDLFEAENAASRCCFSGLSRHVVSCLNVSCQIMDKLGWTKKKGELLLALGRHEEAEALYRYAPVSRTKR